MSLCYVDHSGVILLVLDRYNLAGGSEWKRLAKSRQRRVRRNRAHVGPHHAAHGQLAQPADVSRAADGLAA
jgi:hypothetical protein